MPSPPYLGVFVSSTWLDLEPERKAVEAALQRLRASRFVGMEYFGSRDETTRRASLDEVDRCHVYVGIFAARYGSGITEAEYRHAQERGLKCFIYFKPEATTTVDKFEKDTAQQERLEKLKAELLAAHTVSDFANPDELATKVSTDLSNWLLGEYQKQTRDAARDNPALRALHQLPPPPGDFTGRADELAELFANVERGVQISGLQGQGGIGKTALALKLAEQLAPRYPDAQFYLDLKGAAEQQPLSASDALSHVLRAYHPTVKLPDDEAELRALYLSVLHDQRALLLMDNARDAAQVTPLIPPAPCVLLVTSRQHFHLPGLHAKDLDTLPPADARALLLNIAPRIGSHADEIARLCGHLPLALRVAASIIAERKNLNPANYARRLSDAKQRLSLVEASLKLSYDLLSAKLQRRWRALAVFPATFDAEAAAAVWEADSDAAHDALGDLVRYSLLDWDDATARYSLHDLARLFADSRLSDDERYAAQARHAGHYLEVLDEAHGLYLQGGEAFMRGLALFDAEWTNIQAGQSWAARHVGDNDKAARLCFSYPGVGAYLLELRLHPRERINWSEKALLAARKSDHRVAEADELVYLGSAYHDLGEVRRAIEFHEQALVIYREIGNRLNECSALSNLGNAYIILGELSHAVELQEQQLIIAREISDQRAESNALNNLGNAYIALGETHRAVELFEQKLAIDREIGSRRGEGNALASLGTTYNELGETRRAVELYEQALAIYREIGDRRGAGTALWNMSLLLDALGNRSHAVAYAEESLKIREEIEDPNADKVRKALEEWRGEEE